MSQHKDTFSPVEGVIEDLQSHCQRVIEKALGVKPDTIGVLLVALRFVPELPGLPGDGVTPHVRSATNMPHEVVAALGCMLAEAHSTPGMVVDVPVDKGTVQ